MTGNFSALAHRQRSPSTRISLLEDVREAENSTAWREFVDRYTPLVYGYCRQRKLQESDARDVTQNVFFAVSRAMETFEYDCNRGRFRSWLGTITCREIRRYLSWVNRLWNEDHEAPLPGSERHRDLESEWESAFMTHLFHAALRKVRPAFPAEIWEAFERTWLRDEAPGDVAQQLQHSTAWVYKAKFRVLKRLREEVAMLAEDTPVRPR
jgi:RNA polymerase sigma-70 factor, ECF subfamily